MNTFFSRGDFIATRVAMVTAAALYPLLVLTPKLISWATGGPLVYVGRSAAAGPPLDEPTPGVEGRYSDEVVWRIADASAGQWIASLMPALLTTILLGGGCLLLWRLVVATQHEEPFTATAVRRVRAVGFLVLTYGVVRPFMEPLTTLAIFWSESEPSIAFALDFSLVFPIAVGFLILVVAECFRIGTQIRHDVDGLV
jgi:hypothetical protein